MGPAPVPSRNGFHYYVVFIDDYSRYTWLYFLKAKSEVHDVFIKFKSLVENQFDCHIKAFQSDWGGELSSNL